MTLLENIFGEKNIKMFHKSFTDFLKLSLMHKLFLLMLILIFFYLVNRRSVVYEYYEDIQILKNRLEADADEIQCIVCKDHFENSIPFGETQKPKLWDYADNVNTIDFLLQLS